MPDQFTETTTKGWFSRIGGSIGGVLGGIVLLFACIGVLGWNENRAVRTERALNEGAGMVVDVEPSPVEAANEGALVHVTGETTTTAPLQDDRYGVQATGLSLSRVVEMYQWHEQSRSETRTKLGGGEETVTTYSYTALWSAQRQNSDSFRVHQGHQNPPFPVESESFNATDARLGGFVLDDAIVGRVGGGQSLALDDGSQERARQAAGRGATVSSSTIYIGANPETPAVGDLRISYEVTPNQTISVVAAQSGDGLQAYQARNGERVLLVTEGQQSAEAMFTSAQDTNRIILWAVRAGGLFGLIAGFGLILAPLRVLADVIPLLGTVVGMGLGIVSFVLGLLTATIVIAIAWFAVRPITSLIILLIGGGVAFLFYRFGRKRLKKTRAAQAAG